MDKITSRAVRGEFVKAFGVEQPPSWISGISNEFTSDQASEEYALFDSVGPLREWVGGRNAQGFTDNSITIDNKHFEKTIEYKVKDLRRDKFSVIRAKVGDLVRRAKTHPAGLLSTLILNGEAGLCYDGLYFFDTDHSEKNSGTQSNLLSVDISGLPVATAGTTTAPAVAEFQFAIAKGVQNFMSLKDAEGEPANEMASSFIVMVPPSFFNVAITACATPIQVAETQSALSALKQSYTITPVVNTRLSSWTASFCMFVADSYLKPFVFQRETNYSIKSKAEGSEFEFDYDKHQWGVDYWGNAAYSLWQKACKITLV